MQWLQAIQILRTVGTDTKGLGGETSAVGRRVYI